jgi:hypothetical protein
MIERLYRSIELPRQTAGLNAHDLKESSRFLKKATQKLL